MPPRFAYWTILAGGLPTAFRATEREELLPTFKRIQDKHPDAEMKYFARGKLWESREAAQAPPPRERRGRDWRPGGEHRDPRQKFIDENREKNRERRKERFEKRSRPASPKPQAKAGPGAPQREWSAGPPKPKRDWKVAPPREKPHGDPLAAKTSRPAALPKGPWRDRPAAPKREWNAGPAKPHGDKLGAPKRDWKAKPASPKPRPNMRGAKVGDRRRRS
jgi:hypothetical protein